jgi:hypothetical protein
MDISTGNWFEYLREEVLTEGLRDIGLPEKIVDFIENAMARAPEKAKMYAGNQWKDHTLPSAYAQDVLKKRWLTFMRDNFEDEIQVTNDSDGTKVDVRTITPYRVDRDVGPQQRKQYDDEMIDRNKKIAFVVQNINAAWGKPAGTWRKSFMKAVKALSKAGVESEKAEKVKEWLQTYMMQEFRSWYSQYNELFDWLNNEPTNYELIKNEDDINSAYNTAKQDLENREEPENVLHEFEDGSYWYNLDVSSCSIEGERMGHCGSDSRGVLVSLRKRKEKRKASSSYVTMTWENEGYGGNYLYQIKGRSNEAPPDEVWDHINWFIQNMGITNVQEDGEHSSDAEGFTEMLNYLQQQNPTVAFTGVVDEQAIQEALDEVERAYSDEAENSSVDASVMGPDEHGGEGHYIYMNAYCNLQIDLGWPGIVRRDGDFYSADETDSGDINDLLESIPANTWGSEARDFSSEVEIDNIEWDLPGEGETEWDVTMLTGADPNWEVGEPEPPQTAHLEITIRMTHQEAASDPDEAKWEFEQFADQIKTEFADNYDEIKENIRRKLVEGEFMGKSAFDRTRDSLVISATDLKHWHVYEEGGTVEFWFRISPNHATAINNLGGELGSIPNEYKMWAFNEDQEGMIDGLYSKMFGSAPTGGRRTQRIENPDLSREMAQALRQSYAAAEGPGDEQQQLALGDRYKQRKSGPPWSSVLMSNSRFIILPESSLSGSGYRKQLVNWKFEIFVDARSGEETIEAVKAMVKYFNDNPDAIEDAAQEVIGTRFRTIKSLADANKDEVLSGKRLGPSIQRIDSRWGAPAASGSDEWAERIMMVVKWIKDNWDSMDEVEKWVAYYKYILPMATARINIARDIPNVEMDDNNNLGKPSTWDKYVKDQLNKLGAFGGTVRDYGGVQRGETQSGTVGEPRPVGESAEQQIDRIEHILRSQEHLVSEKDESYDLRIYSIKVDVAIQKNIGGEIQETQTEIRGIEGVTTVRTVGETTDVGTSHTATYEIKFELLGSISRVKYRDRVLIPGLMRVRGCRVLRFSPMHRTNVRGTIRTVRENREKLKEYSIGGLAPNLSAIRQSHGKMNTPRSSLDSALADWVDGGVMVYDVPVDTTNMRYHVMLPVKDLLPHISREFRAPKDAFDGMYQNFIKNGATAPVYVALGKNGRIKVTGNEDLIWFAKKSGLQELPVFLSYQNQV